MILMCRGRELAACTAWAAELAGELAQARMWNGAARISPRSATMCWPGSIRPERLAREVRLVVAGGRDLSRHVHGRRATRKTVDAHGNVRTVTAEVPRAQWQVLIKDHHRLAGWGSRYAGLAGVAEGDPAVRGGVGSSSLQVITHANFWHPTRLRRTTTTPHHRQGKRSLMRHLLPDAAVHPGHDQAALAPREGISSEHVTRGEMLSCARPGVTVTAAVKKKRTSRNS